MVTTLDHLLLSPYVHAIAKQALVVTQKQVLYTETTPSC
jgi:hypothetical protein